MMRTGRGYVPGGYVWVRSVANRMHHATANELMVTATRFTASRMDALAQRMASPAKVFDCAADCPKSNGWLMLAFDATAAWTTPVPTVGSLPPPTHLPHT